MITIDNSDLLMWKESIGQYRFQTTNPKYAKQMRGRSKFILVGNSLSHKLWIFLCRLPDKQSAISRLRGITGQKVKYDKTEEIYYCE